MTKSKIHGICDPAFEAVQAAFASNFEQQKELGASLSIMHKGKCVVDLWAGVSDETTGASWEQDTKSVVWSTTKGMVSMCVLKLVDEGKIDLFAPVTDYWPEYGQAGKQNTLVAHILSQQHGVPVVEEEIPLNGTFDWDKMVGMIERQTPFFEPGTKVAYSPLMYGWLAGEIVRRVSGKSLGTYFRDEIAGPLEADCWIGIPPKVEAEVARMTAPEMVFQAELLDQPGYEVTKIVFTNSGGYTDFSIDEQTGRYRFDTPTAHAAEIGGGGGIANARGLARLYAPWANNGMYNGKKFISPEMVDYARAVVAASMMEVTLHQRMKFSMGFHKSWDNRWNPAAATIFMSEDAFGFAGNGGSIGFASPVEGLSFGYVMNKMNTADVFDRAQALIDETYKVLGYRTRETGNWIK